MLAGASGTSSSVEQYTGKLCNPSPDDVKAKTRME